MAYRCPTAVTRTLPRHVSTPLRRALLFAATGVVFLVYWFVADPGYEVSETQAQWPYVLAFSGIILMSGFAIFHFGRMVGGHSEGRMAKVAAAGAALASVVNVVEDGFGVEWLFVGFMIGTLAMHVGLLGLAYVLAVRGAGRRRWLSLIPLATSASVITFVTVGGWLMLATWLAAAVVALKAPSVARAIARVG